MRRMVGLLYSIILITTSYGIVTVSVIMENGESINAPMNNNGFFSCTLHPIHDPSIRVAG